MAQSAGIWKKGNDHGNYKVLVFREIMEHSRDRVQVQVTRITPAKKETDKPTEEVMRSFWLDSPGIKGYVDAIHFQMIDEQRMALTLDIEMNAMNGVILRELYILRSDGTYDLLQPANYIDIFKVK